jgi:hypothetical protein
LEPFERARSRSGFAPEFDEDLNLIQRVKKEAKKTKQKAEGNGEKSVVERNVPSAICKAWLRSERICSTLIIHIDATNGVNPFDSLGHRGRFRTFFSFEFVERRLVWFCHRY